MRVIKFRAWFPVLRKMLPVGQIDWQGDNVVYLEAGSWKANPTQVTIMQFTGKRDRGGFDIFEGDIVHIHGDNSSIKGVVFFDPVSVAFVVHQSFGKGIAPLTGEHIVIIGNAFENANLLEEKTKFVP